MSNVLSTDSRRDVSILRVVVWIAIVSTLLVGIFAALWDCQKVTGFLGEFRWFHIKELRIESTWPVPVEKVRLWLPTLEGKSLLLVKAQKLVSMLEHKPWVRTVTIRKIYPDNLFIKVEPKQARAITVVKGRPFFVDAQGGLIEKVTPEMMSGFDLPVVTFHHGVDSEQWTMLRVIELIGLFQSKMDSKYKVSQIELYSYPYFSIFLSTPQVEVELSALNWEQQLPRLSLLLSNPPGQIGQIGKISLLFSKKAVVSSGLSN